MSLRVLLVDDQALVRSGFRMLVEAQPGMEVVGEAADGEQAVAETRRTRPDVVLMDIRMPRMDGIEATRLITHADPPLGCRVLLLTTYDLDEYVFRGLRAGASGFLLEDVAPDRGVRQDPRGTGDAARRARVAHRTRARGPRPDREGTRQPRDRRTPGPEHGHREDAREPRVLQAPAPRPCPGRRARVRDRDRPSPRRRSGAAAGAGGLKDRPARPPPGSATRRCRGELSASTRNAGAASPTAASQPR
jgi:chemotaxis response regulator CheB